MIPREGFGLALIHYWTSFPFSVPSLFSAPFLFLHHPRGIIGADSPLRHFPIAKGEPASG
jgi:hypothetical protein